MEACRASFSLVCVVYRVFDNEKENWGQCFSKHQCTYQAFRDKPFRLNLLSKNEKMKEENRGRS